MSSVAAGSKPWENYLDNEEVIFILQDLPVDGKLLKYRYIAVYEKCNAIEWANTEDELASKLWNQRDRYPLFTVTIYENPEWEARQSGKLVTFKKELKNLHKLNVKI